MSLAAQSSSELGKQTPTQLPCSGLTTSEHGFEDKGWRALVLVLALGKALPSPVRPVSAGVQLFLLPHPLLYIHPRQMSPVKNNPHMSELFSAVCSPLTLCLLEFHKNN